jgi:hypothetical protein
MDQAQPITGRQVIQKMWVAPQDPDAAIAFLVPSNQQVPIAPLPLTFHLIVIAGIGPPQHVEYERIDDDGLGDGIEARSPGQVTKGMEFVGDDSIGMGIQQ